jgi:hypothetical protein
MELKVLNVSGKETGASLHLPESVFGIEPNDHAIYLDVKQYLANQRQGTHKSVPVQVVLNLLCLMVVAVYLVRNHATIALS